MKKELSWMEELWFVIAVAVGILAVIAAALLTRKKNKNLG